MAIEFLNNALIIDRERFGLLSEYEFSQVMRVLDIVAIFSIDVKGEPQIHVLKSRNFPYPKDSMPINTFKQLCNHYVI